MEQKSIGTNVSYAKYYHVPKMIIIYYISMVYFKEVLNYILVTVVMCIYMVDSSTLNCTCMYCIVIVVMKVTLNIALFEKEWG